MRILFMGTPDFAVSSLEALIKEQKYELTVVTQPDKPKGRGYTLTPPDVKVCAEKYGIAVYQPETLKGEEFDSFLRQIDPEMIVVAAYGKILPKNVIDYPKYGCINVHGSLLPRYRGAAPIQRAILDGESETGITIMYMNEGLDTGDMLTKVTVPITDDDNFETLFDKMADAGAKALVKTIPLIVMGLLTPEKQNENLATYAAKIEKSDCLIDFSDTAKAVHNRIRALSPFPLGYIMRGNAPLKLIRSHLTSEQSDKSAGTVISADGEIKVVCGDGRCICITELLPAGKKRMSTSDYLRGNRIEAGTKLAD